MNSDRFERRSGDALVASMDEALQVLRNAPSLPDEAVHDARKAIKKARAALRLLREGLGEGVYQTENTALRDAGRFLAPIRDVKSLSDALDAFRKHHAGASGKLGGIATALNVKHLATRRSLLKEGQLRKCMVALTECRERIDRLRAAALPPLLVADGIKRIHRKGRKSLDLAKRERNPEALHEWRKQVKYLTNALQLLHVPEPRLEKLEKRAKKLADFLGDDHDLAELGRHVAAHDTHGAPVGTITKRFEGRRRKLQKKAWQLGARIYGQKPGAVAERIGRAQGLKK